MTRRYCEESLTGFSSALFVKSGLPEADAMMVANGLVRADLRGVHSHGVSRIPMYVERLRRGVVNPRPSTSVEKKSACVSLVDGDDGMGFVVGHRAMRIAMAHARESGVGLVGVRRSTHYGMGALYVLQAVEKTMIGLALTNSSPALAVWGGRAPFLGAAPLAAGVPCGQEPAFVLDMSMTVVARGKIRLAAQRGEPISPGLALDSNGVPTTDARAAFEGGVCLPFGGVKGSSLALLMDVLCGVLTGAAFGGDVKSLYFDHSGPQNVGHFFLAVRPDLFLSETAFLDRMDALAARCRNQPRAQGFDEIMMPGEPEWRVEQRHARDGIPLTDDVVQSLELVAREFAVPVPKSLSAVC